MGEIPVHKIRAYADTSVFGGVFDGEFADFSSLCFEGVHRGRFIVLVSPETARELVKAPVEVKEIWKSLPSESSERVSINEEVRELAEEYIKAGILGRASESDAIHVAAATVAGADLILSWNFKHIVKYNRIIGFNGVNVRNGYHSMMILSPREFGENDN